MAAGDGKKVRTEGGLSAKLEQAAAQILLQAGRRMNGTRLAQVFYVAELCSVKQTGSLIASKKLIRSQILPGPVSLTVLERVLRPELYPEWQQHFVLEGSDCVLVNDPGSNLLNDQEVRWLLQVGAIYSNPLTPVVFPGRQECFRYDSRGIPVVEEVSIIDT